MDYPMSTDTPKTPEEVVSEVTRACHYDVKTYKKEYVAIDEWSHDLANKPAPDKPPQFGLRIISDGSPIGTHCIVYDWATKKDVGELANVQKIKIEMSVGDIVAEVELLCVEVPFKLERGKMKYALGSPDPICVSNILTETVIDGGVVPPKPV